MTTAQLYDVLTEKTHEARVNVLRDNKRWEALQCVQDTEEAEESGRLAGYAEGLEEARQLVWESLRPSRQDAADMERYGHRAAWR